MKLTGRQKANLRQYIWAVFKIKFHYRVKLLRLDVSYKIIKFAFVISPDAKEAIERRMR